jgi:hypothetical protein
VTLADGAGRGARVRRLVTAAPGRLGHQPAGTMTGTRGASLEVRRRPFGESPISVIRPHEAWPEVSLWDGQSLG